VFNISVIDSSTGKQHSEWLGVIQRPWQSTALL